MMRPLGRFMAVSVFFTCLVVMGQAAEQSRTGKSQPPGLFQVKVSKDNLTLDANQAPLLQIFQEIGKQAKITFDPSPVPGGPAGVFRIIAEFSNTSAQAIVNPFVEVVELTGENLLLNADGGAGGVGARLTLPDSARTPFQPEEVALWNF